MTKENTFNYLAAAIAIMAFVTIYALSKFITESLLTDWKAVNQASLSGGLAGLSSWYVYQWVNKLKDFKESN